MSALASSAVPEKRHSMADKLIRIRALDEAGLLIGKAELARKMGVPERTLRSYTSVERRVPDAMLAAAADAIDERCAELAAHAVKLRTLVEQSQ